MDFGFSGNFHFDRSAREEVLSSIKNGLTTEEAVEDWSCGLNDLDYHIVQNFLFSRIVEYIESIKED